MSFRGINTTVIQIRRQVFTEVARMAYANVKGEQANHLMRKIPYTIIPGEEGKLRKDIFLERAIVEERVRLAMVDRKSTRLNSSHIEESRMPSSA